ncbi:hypothetical protein [Lichenicoccus sp.]|uniref:hypothetical protein n=1 Tax=Lichenicoccus sp. TaxID=2781899 RepID=UPI003D0FC7C4
MMLVPTAMPTALHAPGPPDVLVAGPAVAVAAASGPSGLFSARPPGRLYRVILLQPDASGILRRIVTECSL